MSKLLKYVLLAFLKSLLYVYAFLSEKGFNPKNFFLSLDRFMMALCNSSVINGDSFARICFVSIGEYLIVKYWNIIFNFIETVLLKHFRSRNAKIKFADIHPKFFIIKMFLVPMVYYFRWQFWKSYFKLLSASVSWKVPIPDYCVENNLICKDPL